MDASQWCLDECPTCATVVNGPSVYCSVECQPLAEEDGYEPEFVAWSESKNARVNAWALDCFKETLPSSNSPSVFISPSRRKLCLRKQKPTSWVTSNLSLDRISTSASTNTAVDSLASTSQPITPSPITRYCFNLSWADPSLLSHRPLAAKTNMFLSSSDPKTHAVQSLSPVRALTPFDDARQCASSAGPALETVGKGSKRPSRPAIAS